MSLAQVNERTGGEISIVETPHNTTTLHDEVFKIPCRKEQPKLSATSFSKQYQISCASAAAGIAVMFVMVITTCLTTLVMLIIWRSNVFVIALFFGWFMSMELIYLSSNLFKVSPPSAKQCEIQNPKFSKPIQEGLVD